MNSCQILKNYGHLLEPHRSPAIEHLLKTYRLPGESDALLKSWFGPEKGGTHIKHPIDLLFGDRAQRLLSSIPSVAMPEKDESLSGTPKSALAYFDSKIKGVPLTSPLGTTFTAKAGHFFRLIATSLKDSRKGYVDKAKSPEDALNLIRSGVVDGHGISGFQDFRARHIYLFADVVTNPHIILRSKDRPHVLVHLKRYERAGTEFFDAVMLDNETSLGVLSFAPMRKVALSYLQKHDLAWHSGSVPFNPAIDTPSTGSVGREHPGRPDSTIPNPPDISTKSFDEQFDLLKAHIADLVS